MTDEEWNSLPQIIRNAIRAKFGSIIPEDIDRIEWGRCAVDLPYVKRIYLNSRRDWYHPT